MPVDVVNDGLGVQADGAETGLEDLHERAAQEVAGVLGGGVPGSDVHRVVLGQGGAVLVGDVEVGVLGVEGVDVGERVGG